MNVTLIRIDAQDASGTAVPVRIASHDIPEACHLGGEEWEPALATLPDFALDFFGGAFAGQVTAPRTGFAVATIGLAAFSGTSATRARFADARVRIWTGDITSPATVDLGPLTLRFDGRITGEPDVDEASRIARFDAAVQDSWADKPLLALFAGTGGIEGPADLTGQVEPLVLGNARFCGGTLIDNVDNIWMVSNGPVQAVNAVYDRLASLGASAGNFANLAALKAASIPNGGWGTCLALGLVRLGAPPDGRVSFDVSGSNSGTGGYVRRPGAMIRRIADLAGGTVNASSLTALDTARPYNLALQLREQVSARDVIAQIADSVGAVAGVSLRGELFAQALAIGTPSDTLAPDDTSAMRVLPVEELAKAAPSWRLATEAELTFEVHSADEAAFNYRWQGEYAAARVYRRDDVVTGPDGAAWAYINAAPAAGQTLPVWPVTSNAHWRLFQAPAGASVAPANANLVPLSGMEVDGGWVLQFNGAGLSAPTDYGTFEGLRFFRVKATATAPGQTVSIGTAPSGLPAFRLTPGGRISFQTRVELAGPGAQNWSIVLWGFRADGSSYAISAEAGSVTTGNAPRFIANDPVRFFLTVPTDIVSARIELYGISGAAGLMDLVISEPMIAPAAPGQTVHPPYTPGPVLTGPIDAGGPLLIGELPTDKADPGLRNSELVPSITDAANQAAAANAAAFAANAAISIITSDGLLSRDEKPEIRKQRDAIIAEYPTIRARAVALDVAVTNYDSAYNSFAISHPAWDLSGATDTPIDRAAFNAVFTNYYAWRQSVLDGIALEASRRATWGSVTGSGRPEDGSDITRTVSGPADITMQFRADLALLSPLPLTADYQLGVAGASPLTSGVSWSVSVVSGSFTGTAPSIVGSGTGQLRINSALASPEATLRITPSVAGRASPPFVVRVARNVASPSLAPLTSIASSTFAQAHDIPIQITLPSSTSSVSLTAVADLLVNAEAPQGGTTVEGKWQRETSPGTWADVGAPATSSPNPEVFLDEPFPGEFFFTASPGSLTCNRTATGLTPGSIQRFRLVARVSLGNVRTVAFLGNASATA